MYLFDDHYRHLEQKFRRLESKLFELEDELDRTRCSKLTFWKKIYEQSSVSNFWEGCDLERCFKKEGNNLIDFRSLEDKKEYHFKIIWDNGEE